jgi:hypothetical protein
VGICADWRYVPTMKDGGGAADVVVVSYWYFDADGG